MSPIFTVCHDERSKMRGARARLHVAVDLLVCESCPADEDIHRDGPIVSAAAVIIDLLMNVRRFIVQSQNQRFDLPQRITPRRGLS
jgi:hypothetical protein